MPSISVLSFQAMETVACLFFVAFLLLLLLLLLAAVVVVVVVVVFAVAFIVALVIVVLLQCSEGVCVEGAERMYLLLLLRSPLLCAIVCLCITG